MAHDPHHDSIIESLKEIFARHSELEDRLEFLVNELEAHVDFDGCGDRRDIANILGGYYSEFDGGDVPPYKHLRKYCVAYQEGSIGCPDCYDFICDACGEHKEEKPEVLNTETLSGVVMCESCSAPKSCDSSCTNDACSTCGGNTPARIGEQIEWLEKKIAQKVIEQHKGAFQKLANSPTPPAHLPKCKWHKDWHACDCGALDKPDEDILDDEEEALLNRMCDEIEAECFGEDFDYDRERMKETLQNILDSAP